MKTVINIRSVYAAFVIVLILITSAGLIFILGQNDLIFDKGGKFLSLLYVVEDVEYSNYIVAEVGIVGEIAPRVLRNWKIRMPVVGCEMGLGFWVSRRLKF